MAAVSDWQKGGLRYSKLQEIVPEFLEPARVHAFFVAVRSHGRRFRLVNPFTPLQREYVIAATDDGVVVLRLRKPGVFRASIAGVLYQASVAEAGVEWRDGGFVVGGTQNQPITFDSQDAERVAQLLS